MITSLNKCFFLHEVSNIILFCMNLDDHSRVVLNTVENLDGSDYVNANYIDVSLRNVC